MNNLIKDLNYHLEKLQGLYDGLDDEAGKMAGKYHSLKVFITRFFDEEVIHIKYNLKSVAEEIDGKGLKEIRAYADEMREQMGLMIIKENKND